MKNNNMYTTAPKRCFIIFLVCVFTINTIAQNTRWRAFRIAASQSQNESNTWMNFRAEVNVETVHDKAIAKIATDSKYWLWINGKMAVYEGQLKRGPNRKDTYYDEVNIAPYLKNGKNTVAILTWYLGKDGFSHRSSGQAGLVFECDAIGLFSDKTWKARMDKAFQKTLTDQPNYRLPESNIRYDAQQGNFNWVQPDDRTPGFREVVILGEAESSPWNKLVLRPIPQWKDFGIHKYVNNHEIPAEGTGEWISCKLPYNCHAHPMLDVDAPAGITIKIQTDNFDYMGLDVASVRAEYVTKAGRQQYESLGWMNGHVVKYLIPKGVKINGLSYRETGFNCEFSGTFNCSDPFYTKLWNKSRRTLYVTMRDTYMDCPDRERAQWWGDVVNESGMAFYALSPSAASITKKGILELINWQREDGTLYSPVPEGNWNKELPCQMLASVGYFGFWNYYLNTGDKETIEKVYPSVKRYLDLWKLQQNGTLQNREGEWYWGDWGQKIDKELLHNAWYYLALKGFLNMSELLGEYVQVEKTRKAMEAFKSAFNDAFWDKSGYRTTNYEGIYDERAQALAVVSGIADKEKYEALLNIFKTSYLASPYMEKYVLEALLVMGEAEFGLQRMKKRYFTMVEKSPYTTLYENFSTNVNIGGHGTNNHAWSGGALTILSQYVCGLYPLEPAWKIFKVKPQLGNLTYAETENVTVAGKIAIKVASNYKGLQIELSIPTNTEAVVHIPSKYDKISINKKRVESTKTEGEDRLLVVNGGNYIIVAR